jgi:hypothetical protein
MALQRILFLAYLFQAYLWVVVKSKEEFPLHIIVNIGSFKVDILNSTVVRSINPSFRYNALILLRIQQSKLVEVAADAFDTMYQLATLDLMYNKLTRITLAPFNDKTRAHNFSQTLKYSGLGQ